MMLFTAAQLSTMYGLSLLWTSPSPAVPLASSPTLDFLKGSWNLTNSQLYGGLPSDISFVNDKLNNEGVVLEVDYPVGSYTGTNMGGIEFFPQPFPVAGEVQTAMLTYELAFSPGFQFVKGGKLPGLFGGSNVGQCSGGRHTLDCFSARLMWRSKGAGEVYAYIPTYNGFCNNGTVLCNDDYGISLSRGSFSFVPGQWTNVSLLISLNTPPLANGILTVYINDVLVLSHTDVLWRVDPSIGFSKLFFSTFFGGADASWASLGGSTYYRNMRVWASALASNVTGAAVSGTVSAQPVSSSSGSKSPSSTMSSSGATRVTVGLFGVLGAVLLAW